MNLPDVSTKAKDLPRASDALRRELELDVLLGRLRPRERLVEDELMTRFGAKRHQVRAALADLERTGLVERRPHRGAIVREYGAPEVEELYAFRADLHDLAVARMPLPLQPDEAAALESIAAHHEAAAGEGRLADVILLNEAFHDALFARCGNRYLIDSIRKTGLRSRAIRSYRIGDPALLSQAALEHRAMLAAARSGAREEIADLCRRHILPSKELYLRDRPPA